ncbi:MAG: hypothetical protein OXN85_11235 [Gemmatimonadetes bacterium]|nr:hypothetical protein [Candidatus Palauibacter australiensis]
MNSRNSFRRTFALLAVTLAVAACGDDSTGAGGDRLTPEESEALYRALRNHVNLDPTGELPPEVRACTGGGEATLTASVSMSEGESDITFHVDLTLVPRDCVEAAHGRTFKLNGAPSLRETGTYALRVSPRLGFRNVIDMALSGAVTYQTAGRSGTCDISMSTRLEVSTTAGRQTGGASGIMCGNPLEIDLSGPLSEP